MTLREWRDRLLGKRKPMVKMRPKPEDKMRQAGPNK